MNLRLQHQRPAPLPRPRLPDVVVSPAGGPASLVITTQPSSTAERLGWPFATQPVVAERGPVRQTIITSDSTHHRHGWARGKPRARPTLQGRPADGGRCRAGVWATVQRSVLTTRPRTMNLGPSPLTPVGVTAATLYRRGWSARPAAQPVGDYHPAINDGDGWGGVPAAAGGWRKRTSSATSSPATAPIPSRLGARQPRYGQRCKAVR